MENLRSDLSPLSFAFGDPAGVWQLALSGKLRLGAGAEVGWGALLVLPATLAAFVSRRELRPFLPGLLLFLVLWALNHSAVRYLYPLCGLVLGTLLSFALSLLSGYLVYRFVRARMT